MTLSIVARELAYAEEAMRVDLLVDRGRPKLSPEQGEEVALLAREAAWEAEREAQSKGSPKGGLVSLPTTHKRAPSAQLSAQRCDALRKQKGAIALPVQGARLARLRRSVGFSARAHLAERPGFRSDVVVMVTATYRDGGEWEPGHVRALLTHIRNWCNRRDVPCRYVWVAELQKRGAIHYHIALWLPRGVRLPMADAQLWWIHGATRTEVARAAVPYLMKYLSKGSAVQSLPEGARMHAAGGLEHSMRRGKRWLGYPAFIRARADIFDDWTRATIGGGWVDPEGTAIPSEFARMWVGDSYACVRVADYGRPFAADGPFSWIERGRKGVQ